MLGKTLSHFRILSQLGEGGMGVVYEAEDLKLSRRVALKVLPPERVGDEERRERFLREARTAAAISHPNIAAIHAVDEADGVVFIAMELVEGKTLRSVLQNGPPPLHKALRMAAEIAEALNAAHLENIVHRDLKPENVMIRPDGHIKLLDFGLAKLREEAADGTGSTRMETLSAEMTREGKVLGTAAYMSPEQARGQPVDFRSDLFSFGIVLYEMATGRSPFHGPSVTDTLSAIVRDEPAPMAQVAPGVPDELIRITGKCLEKDADERYQHTDDLAMDLRKLRRITDSQPVSRLSDAALPARRGRPAWRRPAPLLLAMLIALAGIVGPTIWLRSAGLLPGDGRSDNALAVLTFQNLEDAEDAQRLGQILQELIITDLSELDTLTVFSSQRLFDIQKQIGGEERRHIDRSMATQVATRAGASTMLTGSLSRLGERWILTGQLVDIDSGQVIKSERIDGADLYRMVDDLTRRIRQDLRLSKSELTGLDRAVGERTTSSIEAYQRYLEGQELLGRWKFDDAAAAFREALSIDPEFGLARYKQAIAAWWALSGEVPDAGESPRELLRGLIEGNYKLASRDRRLAEGMLAVVEDRHEDAVSILSALTQEYPDEKEAWYGLGEAYYHRPGGDREAGYEAFDKALDLDPTLRIAWRHLRDRYRDGKRYREGIERIRELLVHDPDNAGYYEEWVRLLVVYEGDTAGADEVLETALARFPEPDEQRDLLVGIALAHGAGDDVDGRRELLERALALDTEEPTDTVPHELGWHFLRTHDYAQSERYFLRALELNPHGGGALEGLFRVYTSERRFSDGILRARALVLEDPGHLPFYHRWIEMAAGKGDGEEVERAIGAALEHATTGPALERLWIAVGGAYDGLGDDARAIEFYRRAQEANPGEDRWQLLLPLGWSLMSLQRYEEAEEAFVTGGRLDNEARQFGLSGRVRASLELRRFDAAQRLAEEHVAIHPDEHGARADLIRVLLVTGQDSRAEEVLQEGLEAAARNAPTRRLLGNAAWAYLDANRPARAEALARRAVNLDPQVLDPWLREPFLRALLRQDRYEEAEKVVSRTLEVTPREVSLLRTLAQVDLRRGNLAAAERRVRDLLSDGPASRELFTLLAIVLSEQGRFADAEEPARRAFSMNPDRRHHALLSWVLIAGKLDLGEGVRLAQAALELPESPTAARYRPPFEPSPEHALGLAELERGQLDEAVRFLERAAALQPDRALVQEHLARARARQ